eukprot:3940376-Rhodomonas_salina.1
MAYAATRTELAYDATMYCSRAVRAPRGTYRGSHTDIAYAAMGCEWYDPSRQYHTSPVAAYARSVALSA